MLHSRWVPRTLAALWLITGPAAAADLMQVIQDAQRRDTQFAAARHALVAAREKVPQGRAGLLPSANASANWTGNDIDNRTLDRQFGFNSRGYTFTLSQPLVRLQNYAAYKQSEVTVLQAEAVFRQVEQDLLVRTAQAYFDVLAASDTVAFIRAQKVAITEQLAQAKRNFEVGTATITDTNEAQARFDIATAQEIAATNDLETRRRALAQITGERYEELNALRADAKIPDAQPNDATTWAEAATRSNFTVKAQELAAELARFEIERNRYAHYPSLDVVATHGRSVGGNAAASGTVTDIVSSTIGLQLNVPLFAGGATQSRVRESVSLRDKALADLDSARRAAEFNARQSFLGLSAGLAQVSALEQALKSSEVALESNQLGYNVGVRINIDVLNAQQQVFQTRRDLSRARYEAVMNGLKLRAAGGGLTLEDLTAINALLAPAPLAREESVAPPVARADAGTMDVARDQPPMAAPRTPDERKVAPSAPATTGPGSAPMIYASKAGTASPDPKGVQATAASPGASGTPESQSVQAISALESAPTAPASRSVPATATSQGIVTTAASQSVPATDVSPTDRAIAEPASGNDRSAASAPALVRDGAATVASKDHAPSTLEVARASATDASAEATRAAVHLAGTLGGAQVALQPEGDAVHASPNRSPGVTHDGDGLGPRPQARLIRRTADRPRSESIAATNP